METDPNLITNNATNSRATSTPMSMDDFAKTIKTKYPQYQGIDNSVLTRKILQKYPQYIPKVQALPKVTDNSGSINPADNTLSGMINNTASGIKKDVVDPFTSRFGAINTKTQNPASDVLQGAGAIAGGIMDVAGTGIKDAYKTVIPQSVQDTVSSVGGKLLANANTPNKGDIATGVKETTPIDWAGKYADFKKNHPEFAANLEASGNIASIFPVGKAFDALKGIELASDASKGAKALSTTGKIVQGATEDQGPALETLKSLNTTKGIKTYSDLSKAIQGKINDNLTKVSTELSKDKTGYGLSDFNRYPGKSGNAIIKAGGTGIKTNFVGDAMNSLKDLAIKTKDTKLATTLQGLVQKLNTKAFTKNDVNELAKLFGKSESAFGKSGDMLKGTSAQLRENIRKGLKDLAREGMDPSIKKLDELTGKSIDTKALIDKVSESVNAAMQKATQKGFLAKTTGLGVNLADKLSGNIVSSTIRGLAKMGETKVTSVELENALKKNLKTIENLTKNGSDEALKKLVNLAKKGTISAGIHKLIPNQN